MSPDQTNMFGEMPSNKIQENVRRVMDANPMIDLRGVYKELLRMYGVSDIVNHPEWEKVWTLINDAPTIQRRVRDYQNGDL